jgi:hypothetical protein
VPGTEEAMTTPKYLPQRVHRCNALVTEANFRALIGPVKQRGYNGRGGLT